ncbi:hypothetical protein [Intestinimonas butyriciproducens]|uniref:hypothetical protein n=1 Tax=Intestinimonas butyriciproducens TaxID=1297617 RepID=UPI00243291C8
MMNRTAFVAATGICFFGKLSVIFIFSVMRLAHMLMNGMLLCAELTDPAGSGAMWTMVVSVLLAWKPS